MLQYMEKVPHKNYLENTELALLAVLPENRLLGATEKAVLEGLGLNDFLLEFASCMTDN